MKRERERERELPRVDTQTLINKNTAWNIYTNADMNMHECIMMSSVHYRATWDSLSTGLRSMKENAVADMLDKESESTPAC